MRREDTFVMSHRPYAVDLTSLTSDSWWTSVTAVWFRRRRGTTVACLGRLWAHQDPAPKDATEFLQRHTDGRHGGDCWARWDGTDYWGVSGDPAVMNRNLELLRPMLKNFPQAPAGFEGWWTFR